MSEPRNWRSLRSLVAEQNALASIDIVYFLTVPVTLYVMGRFAEVGQEFGTTILSAFIGFPRTLISLPFGLYSKMVDSVTYRIVAWGILALMTSLGISLALLVLPVRLLVFPALLIPLFPTSFLINLSFNLGIFTVAMGIAGVFMRWVLKVFVTRAPSRKLEVNRGLRAINKPVLRYVVVRMQMETESNILLMAVGLAIYAAFIVFNSLQGLGWYIP